MREFVKQRSLFIYLPLVRPRNILSGLLLCCLTACASTDEEKITTDLAPGTDLIALRNQAADHYSNGELQESLVIFQQLVEQVPEDADLWFRLGNVYARMAQPQPAEDAYQQALVRDPRTYRAWRNLSAIQLREAANSLTQLMEILPPNHELYASSLYLTREVLKLIGEQPEQNNDQDIELNPDDSVSGETD